VKKGTKIISQQQKKSLAGGQLGSPNGAKAKTYKRREFYINKIKQMPLFPTELESLNQVMDDLIKYPLKESALVKLNRQLRSDITDEQLAKMVVSLREDEILSIKHENEKIQDNQIIY